MRAPLVATIIAALALLPRAVRADDPPPAGEPALASASAASRAAELFAEAKRAIDEGRKEEARKLLAEAFGLQKSWDIAANLGSLEIELGAHADAAAHVSFALGAFPVSGSVEKRNKLAEWLEQAKAKIGTVRLGATVEGAELTVDGKGVGRAPLAEAVFVMPGAHVFGASHPQYEGGREERTLEAGSEMEIQLTLVPKQGPPPGGSGIDWAIAGTGFALGGAALITAVGLGAASAGKLGDVNDIASWLDETGTRCPRSSSDPTCTEIFGAAADRNTLAGAAVGLGVAAGAILAATGIYAVTAGSSKAPVASVAPYVSPFGIGFCGRF
ncbi:MAG: PEGA domain-containing protein [Myxococcales bacterium]|nr:PEGA domain-containing protein [Myxococcales bacterium]